MPRSAWSFLRFGCSWALLPLVVLLAIPAVLSPSALAQPVPDLVAEGYISAVQYPNGFDVDGVHLTLRPNTGFGLMRDGSGRADSPLKSALLVGSYVYVQGSVDRLPFRTIARTVLFRDDWNQKLTGLGVIDKVIETGPEPVFRADGFSIRITSRTKTSFQGSVQSLADVATNTWLRYEGKRDSEGVIQAAKAHFICIEAKNPKPGKQADASGLEFEPPDLDLKKDGQIKLPGFGGVHAIPADRALQERVARIGLSVVPAYQKLMPDDSPYKVRFAFYAMDDSKLHSEFCTSKGGLIVIPLQMVERLQSDGQLAAVLADGVVFAVQGQGIRLLVSGRVELGMEIAGLALLPFSTGLGADLATIGAVQQKRNEVLMQEQRGRVALGLLADAGYNPRQAPEAWRLLGPKELPKDVATLPYPDRSAYQLSILNFRSGKAFADAPSGAARRPVASTAAH